MACIGLALKRLIPAGFAYLYVLKENVFNKTRKIQNLGVVSGSTEIMMTASEKKGVKRGSATIITGASTGIGKELALLLASRYGARLVINARSSEELNATAALIKEAGGEAICVPGDVTDENVATQIVQTCVLKFGGVDILVNNAGLTKPGRMSDLTISDWRYVFEVNFFAALTLTYACLPHFRESKGGKIANIASVAGKIAFPGTICYAASKFALTGFSEGMAAEFASEGIDIITVCPGWVRTEFFKKNNTYGDPSALADQKNLSGWLMRNVLSISSQQAASEVADYLDKGGSHEIVLTAPGIFIERLAGISPKLAFWLASHVPVERLGKRAAE